MARMNAVLSLDIGGTKLSAAVLARDGNILTKERAPNLAHEGPHCVIARLLDLGARANRSAGVPDARCARCSPRGSRFPLIASPWRMTPTPERWPSTGSRQREAALTWFS